MKNLARVITLLIGSFFLKEIIAQCSFTGFTTNRTRLYLYFPTAQDATFPEYNADYQTSPLEPFNVADLDAGIGTTAQLRDRITDIVREDYCEFDVEVIPTTTAPATTGSQWQIVGIGSDEEDGGNLFGVAQDVDLNNTDPQDYSRVYARSFDISFGGTGGALNGANSTLQRWATAIGHTVSHEAGHNFGLSHNNSSPRAGEDETNNHIMATGSTGLTGEIRAARNRHFSDQSYEILGHNVGLKVKTLYNWDFINPNAEEAHSMVITLLSPAASLTLSWFYNGDRSPWSSPSITASGTQSFHGTTYNRFLLTFNTAKAWSGGSNGIVPGGAEFHTGASFNQSDPIIVYETRLRNAANANLNLHPRLAGFNNGTADLGSGDFNIRAFNPNPGDGLLRVENVQLQFVPRMVSIESMLSDVRPVDIFGVPVNLRPARIDQQKGFDLKEDFTFKVASFKDPRFVDIFYDSTKCKPGIKADGVSDLDSGEYEYCPNGWALSLFPSTYVYLVATVVQPNAKYWDKAQAKYVTGDLRSKVFYQFSGVLPDFNKNGIDDLVDIRTKTSIDKNNNGIVDEAEKATPPNEETEGKGFSWWWILLLILFGLLLIFLLRRKK